MEARKITIVQTKNQKKSVINSSATTLGELKDDLRTNGIDYEGMTFYEGLSKTELKTDESILPHDIERDGVITNELVFMLTNTEKKIRSGASAMTRGQAYDAIKKNNLQDECKRVYGKNFTQCATNDLIVLVEKNTKGSKAAPKAETKKDEPKGKKKQEEVTMIVAPAESVAPAAPANEEPKPCVDVQARAAITELVNVLYEDDTIDEDTKDSVLSILGGSVEIPAAAPVQNSQSQSSNDCPYSDDEINKMFRGM